jgi:hypothetical protein
MIKILLLFTTLFASSIQASLIDFEPNQPIKAQDLNNNFSVIKTNLQSKNVELMFNSYNSGQIILKSGIEFNFQKVRDLGIQIPFLPENNQISSADLTVLFSAAINGVLQYDDIPIARNVNVSVNEDESISSNFDISNVVGSSQVQIVSQPTKGVATINGSSFNYVPSLNNNGMDSFIYRVYDGNNYSEQAVVNIIINPVNDVPVAESKNRSIQEGSIVVIPLGGSDVDNQILSFEISSNPIHGTVEISGDSVTYTPNLNYNGMDTFSYVAKDSISQSVPALVTINISPVNDAPIALAQVVNLSEDTSQSFIVSGTDIEGSSLTYSLVSSPSVGTLTGTLPNLNYTPPVNYNGTTSFKFKVSDGDLNSEEATVSLVISPVNDAPVSSPQSIDNKNDSVNINLAGADIDGDSLTYEIVNPPTNGSLSIIEQSVVYTPSAYFLGTDTFSYRVKDSTLYSNTNVITITNPKRWPVGKDLDLVITNGQIITLNAGEVKDYNNLTINQGGTLLITGGSSSSITQIGVKGNLVINGIIRANDGIFGTVSSNSTAPNLESVTYSITQSSAGAGSAGTGGAQGAGGGAGNLGIGGGGGGGGAGSFWGGAGGINGGAGNPGNANIYAGGTGNATFTNGQGGGAHRTTGFPGGGSGGGGAGAQCSGCRAGSGGAGGGYKGKHGLGLYMSIKGTSSSAGTGRFELNGTNGFNGGGTPGPGDYGTGGAGGGGAGGSGGRLWIRNGGASLPAGITVVLTGGLGGTGGTGALGTANGGNGQAGIAGSLNFGPIP